MSNKLHGVYARLSGIAFALIVMLGAFAPMANAQPCTPGVPCNVVGAALVEDPCIAGQRLRQAIEELRGVGGNQIINLTPGAGRTVALYRLCTEYAPESVRTGLPMITATSNIRINGASTTDPTLTVIEGIGEQGVPDANFRLFRLERNATLSIFDVTLQHGAALAPGNATGGAIFNAGGLLALERCVVQNNICGLFGGGISAKRDEKGPPVDANTQLRATCFRNNIARGVLGSPNQAGEGGAVHCVAGFLRVEGCAFTDNQAQTLTPSESSFGGALALFGTQLTLMTGFQNGNVLPDCVRCAGDPSGLTACTSFRRNRAHFGGAASFQNVAVLELSEVLFAGNEAIDSGGAVFNLGSSYTFERCFFGFDATRGTGNTAQTSGGAVFSRESAPRFVRCRFEQNEARGQAGNGGAAFNLRSNSCFSECSFDSNIATMGGGAVFCDDTGSGSNFNDCRFIENSAGRAADAGPATTSGLGGAVANRGSNNIARFYNCYFSRNMADTGGSIWNLNARTLMLHCTVVRSFGWPGAARPFGVGSGIHTEYSLTPPSLTTGIYNSIVYYSAGCSFAGNIVPDVRFSTHECEAAPCIQIPQFLPDGVTTRGNRCADPLVGQSCAGDPDPANNVHLPPNSPAIDAASEDLLRCLLCDPFLPMPGNCPTGNCETALRGLFGVNSSACGFAEYPPQDPDAPDLCISPPGTGGIAAGDFDDVQNGKDSCCYDNLIDPLCPQVRTCRPFGCGLDQGADETDSPGPRPTIVIDPDKSVCATGRQTICATITPLPPGWGLCHQWYERTGPNPGDIVPVFNCGGETITFNAGTGLFETCLTFGGAPVRVPAVGTHTYFLAVDARPPSSPACPAPNRAPRPVTSPPPAGVCTQTDSGNARLTVCPPIVLTCPQNEVRICQGGQQTVCVSATPPNGPCGALRFEWFERLSGNNYVEITTDDGDECLEFSTDLPVPSVGLHTYCVRVSYANIALAKCAFVECCVIVRVCPAITAVCPPESRVCAGGQQDICVDAGPDAGACGPLVYDWYLRVGNTYTAITTDDGDDCLEFGPGAGNDLVVPSEGVHTYCVRVSYLDVNLSKCPLVECCSTLRVCPAITAVCPPESRVCAGGQQDICVDAGPDAGACGPLVYDWYLRVGNTYTAITTDDGDDCLEFGPGAGNDLVVPSEGVHTYCVRVSYLDVNLSKCPLVECCSTLRVCPAITAVCPPESRVCAGGQQDICVDAGPDAGACGPLVYDWYLRVGNTYTAITTDDGDDCLEFGPGAGNDLVVPSEGVHTYCVRVSYLDVNLSKCPLVECCSTLRVCPAITAVCPPESRVCAGGQQDICVDAGPDAGACGPLVYDWYLRVGNTYTAITTDDGDDCLEFGPGAGNDLVVPSEGVHTYCVRVSYLDVNLSKCPLVECCSTLRVCPAITAMCPSTETRICEDGSASICATAGPVGGTCGPLQLDWFLKVGNTYTEITTDNGDDCLDFPGEVPVPAVGLHTYCLRVSYDDVVLSKCQYVECCALLRVVEQHAVTLAVSPTIECDPPEPDPETLCVCTGAQTLICATVDPSAPAGTYVFVWSFKTDCADPTPDPLPSGVIVLGNCIRIINFDNAVHSGAYSVLVSRVDGLCDPVEACVQVTGRACIECLECFWENGQEWDPPYTGLNAERSQVPLGDEFPVRKVADDFFLCHDQMHHITKFVGTMLTNNDLNVPARARLEFFTDCNGKPAELITTVESNRFSDIGTFDFGGQLYRIVVFEFLPEDLWLRGGSYWVSLQGVGDSLTNPAYEAYWAIANPVGEGGSTNPLKGRMGHKIDYTNAAPEWMPMDECCIGCVDLAFCLEGHSCPICHDNGLPATDSTADGSRSEYSPTTNLNSRSADQFVLSTCHDDYACYIEAYIWTDCIPPFTAHLEIYKNDCDVPKWGTGPLRLAEPPYYHRLADIVEHIEGVEVFIDGRNRQLYRLIFLPPGPVIGEPDPDGTLKFLKGMTYWLSVSLQYTFSTNERAYFAYNGPCPDCPGDNIRYAPGREIAPLRPPAPITQWSIVTDDLSQPRDHAFLVAIHGEHDQPSTQPPDCPADVNQSGTVTNQDLFDFLAAYFAGCP